MKTKQFTLVKVLLHDLDDHDGYIIYLGKYSQGETVLRIVQERAEMDGIDAITEANYREVEPSEFTLNDIINTFDSVLEGINWRNSHIELFNDAVKRMPIEAAREYLLHVLNTVKA